MLLYVALKTAGSTPEKQKKPVIGDGLPNY